MPVIYTRAAIRNLAAIRAYIGSRNPAAANRIAVQIVAACDRLEYLPERGRPGLKAGTREIVALWPYVIVYRINLATVEILNIWHGAQDRDG
ncbi:MAG: type II toxin-antitoxin system RelE/ParE family toxin [Alphaproteobacteria bacterium]|nr:type II toxin-antitoxin system RelE/ParE family toxin [Alphaproteobacteria bacterium]